ncbi:hypothetical protein AG1IA_08719 [Rhizoctonia solani AG-1 IA]|uniref:Uncharacterized protein n=1 Tax=Thanatephorus cucumeris (strain AG1-IA) TaxID=983506 RepID=L8WLP8_THACA|nr:hypothetical protein AG1IA_08719 [Rhizoctonia solani AG-1 IA]
MGLILPGLVVQTICGTKERSNFIFPGYTAPAVPGPAAATSPTFVATDTTEILCQPLGQYSSRVTCKKTILFRLDPRKVLPKPDIMHEICSQPWLPTSRRNRENFEITVQGLPRNKLLRTHNTTNANIAHFISLALCPGFDLSLNIVWGRGKIPSGHQCSSRPFCYYDRTDAAAALTNRYIGRFQPPHSRDRKGLNQLLASMGGYFSSHENQIRLYTMLALRFSGRCASSLEMCSSYLGWITLTHAHEIPYNSRVLTPESLIHSFVVVLVGYDTKVTLRKDPNTTQHEYWWESDYLPSILRFKDDPGDCEIGKLNQDVTLKTNSTLPLFPYQFKSSYIFKHSDNIDGAKAVTRFVDGPYHANPLSSCFVSEMGLYYEPWWENFRATVTCEPTDQLPRFFKFTTIYSASGTPYMRPDSTLDYFILDVHPDKTALDFQQWIDQYTDFEIDNRSRLNVLGVLDALAGDLSQIGWLQFDRLSDKERAAVSEMAFFGWNLKQGERTLDDGSRLELFTPDPWYTEFSNNANRTIINFMVAIRDKRVPKLDPSALLICTWTRGCLPKSNITWAEILREDVGKLPYNNIILPIVEPDPTPMSVIDMTYLCPIYVRKSSGDLLVSVFSARPRKKKRTRLDRKFYVRELLGCRASLDCRQIAPEFPMALQTSQMVATISPSANDRF